MARIPCSESDKFNIFIVPLPLKVTLILKRPYFTAHIKINYEVGYIGNFLKKLSDVFRTIATAKIELFVALVRRFQLLTNFTKNSIIGATGVLQAP